MSGSLSDHDVAAYRRDGFIYPFPALTRSEAASYRQSIDIFEQRFNLAVGDVIRNKGHLKHVSLYQLIRHPAILDAVESVLGPNILCWGSSLFVKNSGEPGFIAWHQDDHCTQPARLLGITHRVLDERSLLDGSMERGG